MPPKLAIARLDILGYHAFVVGVEHGDQARVAGSLHVVLATQWVQARARLADLASDQRQLDQAARVVGAVDVLADAHAPEDDCCRRGRVPARDLLQRLSLNPANGGHSLGRETGQVGTQGVKTLSILRNILGVGQPLFDDCVHHGVEHGDVAAGLKGQVLGRVTA